MWWDDFAVPDDPKQGIEPGPPITPVCLERMPDDWFDAIPCEVWGPEGGFPPDATEVEPVTVRYNRDKKKLIFDFAPEGFEIRTDGIGIYWYGGPGDGLVRRLEFTPQRAKFMDFDRTTGKLEGTSVLTPLSEPFCPSTD
ncbi:MAG TPA: hypothetical protein PLB35_10855 [Myxococcota bacterium]|nr:hypothetical protein [Myxococcota bacterium]HOH77741.1 hypothetical protein [Myxococcota bacterium]HPV04354.1 hypothetical protein [Myxococcota bacterium]